MVWKCAKVMHLPLNLMIVVETLFVFVGSVQGLFLFSLYVSPGLIRGGYVTHNFSFVTRTRV
jgi:hypothetical protein